LGWKKLVETMHAEVLRFIAAEERLSAVHFLADKRLNALPRKRPATLLTSVGRLTDQKLRLFREPTRRGTPALERILEELGNDGLLIVLGSGDRAYEQFIADVGVRFDNLLFIRGYSDPLAEALYASGDLFLMPSSFEPCGISQMLAMRAGQPCVVHAVGGLKDTVSSRTGFPFDGDTPAHQAQDLVREVATAVELKRSSDEQWKAVCEAAAEERFEWDTSAERYVREVYAIDAD
jgi:starch synthase